MIEQIENQTRDTFVERVGRVSYLTQHIHTYLHDILETLDTGLAGIIYLTIDKPLNGSVLILGCLERKTDDVLHLSLDVVD